MLPKINAVKKNENDKFVITLGEFLVSDKEFETKEEAENYIAESYNFTEFEEQVICAIVLKVNLLNEQIKEDEK